MWSTEAVVLSVVWFLGRVGGATMGGFVRGLLVLAVTPILLRPVQGRRLTMPRRVVSDGRMLHR